MMFFVLPGCSDGEESFDSQGSELHRQRGSVTIVTTGDPSVGPYTVGATTTVSGDVRIEFWDNGVLRATEHDAPYCLTPEVAGACTPGSLGAGTHQLVVNVLTETGTTVLARASATIVEAPASSPPPPPPPTPSPSPEPPPPTAPPAWPVPTGKILYVSLTGSDSADGSQAAPFRSLGRAAKAVVPGVTVLVAPGDYAGDIVTAVDGTASARIVFLSSDRWGARIKTGSTDTGWWNKAAYTDVIGFEVDGTAATSWRSGIYATGAHSSTQYCKVHDILRDATAFAAAEASHNGGAALQGDNWYGNDDINLIGNLVFAVGPATKTSSLVHGIYQTAAGTVANNVVYDTVGVGITTWHDAHDISIVNNTIYAARDCGICVGAGDAGIFGNPISARAGDYLTVANNVVVESRYGITEGGQTGTHNVHVDNLVYGNVEGSIILQHGLTATGTLLVDPRFVDTTNLDFHLLAGSPAIDSASSTYAVATDFDRRTRPSGSADRGAFEAP
jgi:hypothetical protein